MNVQHGLDRLMKKGYKYTKKREDILRYFNQENRYWSAKDLLRSMRASHESISFDTIYRNLYLFVQLDILEVTDLNGEKHFRIKCDKHHHHFICLMCGITKEINLCPIHDVIKELPHYFIEDHKFEVYGTCPTCKSA
ncbi:Fur family transcriptional regulator [Pontibacillus litoralis]|uniref:Fur family transcriptional regulator n=1 Tax=Pontibacillus litoralis JSM 072002 TaxID=1385512 RepID=A0A0A5HQ62_9BACI|nr:Fur family transcriptional regulator [Pontibacillus litoralis]KGX85762.1 Fur family transcriptional regulator [Pontibacillus litoralis JSM 072002]